MNAKIGRSLNEEEALEFGNLMRQKGLEEVKVEKQNQGWLWRWNVNEKISPEEVQEWLFEYEKQCGVFN